MTWSGHKAAVSLTFDDGTLQQRDYALPELDKLGFKATFFIICSREVDAWKEASVNGHEIGSHSVFHLCANESNTPADIVRDVVTSKYILQDRLDCEVVSFAYPFTKANDYARAAAEAVYQQARGAYPLTSTLKYINETTKVNWFYTPGVGVNPKSLSTLPGIFDNAMRLGAWVTLIFHGVGPDETQWGNISSEQFTALLWQLKSRDLWVAPYGTVAEYLRAQ